MPKLVKVIIGLVIIVLVGVGIYFGFINKSNLEVDENIIKELYSIVEANGYLGQSSKLSYPAYNSNVGAKEKLIDEDIIYIAYNQIEEKNFEKIYNETNFKNAIGDNYNLYTYYEDDLGKYMLSVAKEQILNKARELFGRDLEITNYDVNIANDIFYKDGYYYEVKDVPMTGASIYYGWESDYFGNGFETCGYTLYDKYKANDDEVIIYAYYINAYEQIVSGRKYASQTSNKKQEYIVNFSDNELEELRNKEWTNALKEKAGYYKHTFTKDENGNYYWNNTELI